MVKNFDQADEKGRRPGRDGSAWWKKNYRQARRWPVPEGKDPGEAAASGVDFLTWINDALPRPIAAPAPQAAPQGTLGNFQSGPPPGEIEDASAETMAGDGPEKVCRHDLGTFEYLWADETDDEKCHIVCDGALSWLDQCLKCPARPQDFAKFVREIRKNRENKN